MRSLSEGNTIRVYRVERRAGGGGALGGKVREGAYRHRGKGGKQQGARHREKQKDPPPPPDPLSTDPRRERAEVGSLHRTPNQILFLVCEVSSGPCSTGCGSFLVLLLAICYFNLPLKSLLHLNVSAVERAEVEGESKVARSWRTNL